MPAQLQDLSSEMERTPAGSLGAGPGRVTQVTHDVEPPGQDGSSEQAQHNDDRMTRSDNVIDIDGYHCISCCISWDINGHVYSNGLMDIELSKPSAQIIGH